MAPWLIFTTSLLAIANPGPADEITFVRDLEGGWKAHVHTVTEIERHPPWSEPHPEHENVIILRGGDIRTDTAHVHLLDPTSSEEPATVWLKTHRFYAGRGIGEVGTFSQRRSRIMRVRVYDVTYYEQHLFVAYSYNAKQYIDVLVRDQEGAWTNHATIDLPRLQIDGLHPRVLWGGRFVLMDEEVYLQTDMNRRGTETEVWSVEFDSATEIIDRKSDVYKAVLKRAAELREAEHREEAKSSVEQPMHCHDQLAYTPPEIPRR